MPGENVQDWSTTAADNANSDISINWAEGQPRASVNNSARAMMAAHAKNRDLQDGAIATTGTANEQAFISGVGYTEVPTGMLVRLKMGATNTATATLDMDAIGPVTILQETGAELLGGELQASMYVEFRYDGTNWILLNRGRQSLYAAPFDAMAYNGLQINGAMGVNQENSLNTAITVPSIVAKYIVDGFYVSKGSTATITAKQIIGGVIGNGYYRAALEVTAGSAMTSGANDYLYIGQKIEGMRIAKLGWGNSIAQPITVAFWVKSTVAGNISLAVQNGAIDRSYTADVVLVGGNVWEYKTVTVPGDVIGTWERNNVTGITVLWTLASGAVFQTTEEAWRAGNYVATPAQTNLLSTLGNQVVLTGVTVLPGLEAPTAERSSYITRPADNELITCGRYLQVLTVAGLYLPASGTPAGATASIPMTAVMRTSPTIYLPWADFNYSPTIVSNTWALAIPGIANISKTGTLTVASSSQAMWSAVIFYGAAFSGDSVAINSGSAIDQVKLDARL